MAKSDPHSEWIAATGSFHLAIRDAGIEQAWNALSEGSAGFKSGEQQAADQRKLVFGVKDVERRKQIIHWDRECMRLCITYNQHELQELHRVIREDGRKTRANAVWGAVVLGAGAVLLAGPLLGSYRRTRRCDGRNDTRR